MKVYCFCKYPEPGKVKTRLAQTIGDNEAAILYEKMLCSMLRLADSSSFHFTFYHSGSSQENFEQLLPHQRFLEQPDGSLGQKLEYLMKWHFEQDDEPLCFIGSDCIEMETTTLEYAANDLRDRDIVFGPATDGGYYLIAMNKLQKNLFADIPWSTEKVLESSINQCYDDDLTYSLLDIKADIDTFEDLPDTWKSSYQQLIKGNADYAEFKNTGKIPSNIPQ